MDYDDGIEEEMRIADEQDQVGDDTLNADIFRLPISDLDLKVPIVLETNATVKDAIDLMQSRNHGCVLLTENGKLVGVFTERDIQNKIICKVDDYSSVFLKDYMTGEPVTLFPSDMICFVLHNMHVGGFRNIPVVNEKHEPVGLVTIRDVVTFILDYFPNEINNVLSEPWRGKAIREGA